MCVTLNTAMIDCSYLAVPDLTERTFLSGGGVHVHPMPPTPSAYAAYAPASSRNFATVYENLVAKSSRCTVLSAI